LIEARPTLFETKMQSKETIFTVYDLDLSFYGDIHRYHSG